MYDRVSMFIHTLWRDFGTFDLSDHTVVIVTHGSLPAPAATSWPAVRLSTVAA